MECRQVEQKRSTLKPKYVTIYFYYKLIFPLLLTHICFMVLVGRIFMDSSFFAGIFSKRKVFFVQKSFQKGCFWEMYLIYFGGIFFRKVLQIPKVCFLRISSWRVQDCFIFETKDVFENFFGFDFMFFFAFMNNEQ